MNHKETILHVGVSSFPPLVMKQEDRYAGFEIDLWEAIAARLEVKTRYHIFSLSKLLQQTKQGEVDIGFAGISKTESREQLIDFSHATFKSGLNILVRTKGHFRLFASLRNLVARRRQIISGAFLGLATFVIFMSHLIWFAERGHGAFKAEYSKGILDAIWYVIVTITTVGYGDFVPVTFIGRLLGAIIIIIGYAIFALFIAELNSVFVLEKISTSIHEPDDLRRKRVATVKSTVTENILEKYGAIILAKPTFEACTQALASGEVEAVVFDAPVIQHYVKNHGSEDLHVVGPRFYEHDYGFILPEKSSWTERINRALLRLMEDGEYDRIYRTWFVT